MEDDAPAAEAGNIRAEARGGETDGRRVATELASAEVDAPAAEASRGGEGDVRRGGAVDGLRTAIS